MIRPSPRRTQAALDAKLEGLSRNDVAARAAMISKTYRDGGGSGTIKSETDALAYALARMPATYAAVAACLNALPEVTARFRAAIAARCRRRTGHRELGRRAKPFPRCTLSRCSTPIQRCGRWRSISRATARASAIGAMSPARPAPRSPRPTTADLVIASYVIGELGEAERSNRSRSAMWAKTRDTLLIVEPGTPAGYARIIALAAQLIAAGAHVAAPCPHDGNCPLSPPDWCHFAQRLPRSRAHMQVKGADVPFEDEKFSYVALTRSAGRAARIPRAGATRGRQGRDLGEALHGRRPRHRQGPAPRQGGLCDAPGAGAGATRSCEKS